MVTSSHQADQPPTVRSRTNWARNVVFGAERFHEPASLDALQELVAGSHRLRVLGTGHSFNRIADTTGDLVSLAAMPPVLRIDRERATATVAAGLRFGEITGPIHDAGLALHDLGSLPHISVAGACATGTHGSGDGCGNLASAVSALELVTATGELLTLTRDDERFAGSVVALGALGVVTTLTFDLVPAFDVRQWVYEDVPADDLAEILAGGYSVSAFTYWERPGFDQVWLKRRAADSEPGPDWMGGRPADGPRHMIRGVPPEHCTEQGGVPGPWHERLPHFQLAFTPSNGEELQSEYLVGREHGPAALEALHRIGDRIAPVLQVSEVRSVAPDELWLSTAHRRASVALHFTWVPDADAVAPVVAAVEEALAPFAARPHWGKVFGTGPDELRGLYEHAGDFARLRAALDPDDTFGNPFLDRCFGPRR